MTDQARSAKARRIRFFVWFVLVGMALFLMLPWEAWFGQELFPFAFARFRGEFRGESVSISLSGRATLDRQIPICVQINMVDGVCRVVTDDTTIFTMGVGSAGVDSAGVDTLVLDPGAGSGSYEVYLANRWYQRLGVLRWGLACVMLFVLGAVCAHYLIRRERQFRTERAYLTKDARQQAVSMLDPIRMHLLCQHDLIPAESLEGIARDLVPGLRKGWRARLWVSLIVTVGGGGLGLIYMRVGGSPLSGYLYSLPGFILAVIGLVSIWYGFRVTRRRRVRDVLLRHLRCPHCGYDIRGLPTAPRMGGRSVPSAGVLGSFPRRRP